jgi:hypothetical protein
MQISQSPFSHSAFSIFFPPLHRATPCASPSFPRQKPTQGAPHCAIHPSHPAQKHPKQHAILKLRRKMSHLWGAILQKRGINSHESTILYGLKNVWHAP